MYTPKDRQLKYWVFQVHNTLLFSCHVFKKNMAKRKKVQFLLVNILSSFIQISERYCPLGYFVLSLNTVFLVHWLLVSPPKI